MGTMQFKTLLRLDFDGNVQFTHDGKCFTCSDLFSKAVKLVDFDSAKDIMSFVEPEGSLQCLAMSDDGKYLATAYIGPNMVVLWDRASGKRIKEVRATIADSLCFSPDSRHLVMGQHDGTIRVCSTEDLDSHYYLGSHSGGYSRDVRGAAFTKDGVHVISISQNGSVKIWNLKDKTEVKTLSMDCPKALGTSNDGSCFAVGCDDGFVRVFGIPSWEPIREIKVSDETIFRVALNCDGSLVAASKSAKDIDSLAIISTKTGKLVSKGNGHVNCISFHPTEPDTLLTGYSESGKPSEVRLWSASNGRCFVATAVYGSSVAPPVLCLRAFRDYHLLKHEAGRAFIALYNQYGPQLAPHVKRLRFLGQACRRAIELVCGVIQRYGLDRP